MCERDAPRLVNAVNRGILSSKKDSPGEGASAITEIQGESPRVNSWDESVKSRLKTDMYVFSTAYRVISRTRGENWSWIGVSVNKKQPCGTNGLLSRSGCRGDGTPRAVQADTQSNPHLLGGLTHTRTNQSTTIDGNVASEDSGTAYCPTEGIPRLHSWVDVNVPAALPSVPRRGGGRCGPRRSPRPDQ